MCTLVVFPQSSPHSDFTFLLLASWFLFFTLFSKCIVLTVKPYSLLQWSTLHSAVICLYPSSHHHYVGLMLHIRCDIFHQSP
ncbi:hypothetical protein GDO78_002467 [Eleutherodactylus coqui]|uniref:Uncharacterized protein n=1 Tax=Eleutherodactylus coqui TaxID=57060 RepID=A0A8J6EYP7_ELECQ|nr:hypothetical protein GDO78_002467 [Eleutherodactylus coqui]